jgi:hypothetical protein
MDTNLALYILYNKMVTAYTSDGPNHQWTSVDGMGMMTQYVSVFPISGT